MINIIFYDIEENKLRKQISDCLIQFGYLRIQYSVFAGNAELEDIEVIFEKLESIVKKAESEANKIFIIKVTPSALKNMKILGKVTFDVEELCGERTTLII